MADDISEMADDCHEEDFFESSNPPENYEVDKNAIQQFCENHAAAGRRIVLVTSGGTTVPLEHNTVRFVDNFSAGTRGSASAEYFLDKQYAVLFLFRFKSLEPFRRHFSSGNFMDHLDIKTSAEGRQKIEVSSDQLNYVLPILEKYQAARQTGTLLSVAFTTLADYLWLLRCSAQCLSALGREAMFYLAAAVSDFYLPPHEMSTHKIHSDVPLSINLKLVPKMLRPLVRNWVPDAYVISFKLETDSNVLIEKARQALTKYGHQMVIANMLQTRKRRVTLVTADSILPLELKSPKDDKIEIEQLIIDSVTDSHTKFIGVGITP